VLLQTFIPFPNDTVITRGEIVDIPVNQPFDQEPVNPDLVLFYFPVSYILMMSCDNYHIVYADY
jgi:hypothetical protein